VGETLAGVGRVPLERLGLWQAFLRQDPEPAYLIRTAWERAEPSDKDSLFDPMGPSYHIDRVRFDAALIDAARDAGAVFTTGRVAAAAYVPRTRSFEIDAVACGRHALSARFLIDATGRSAFLAQRLGARREVVDDLIGIARWFDKREPLTATLVEATPDGYFYSAPLPGGKLVAVWMTDAKSPAGRAAQPDVWQRCLAASPLTGARLAGAVPDGRPSVALAFPALTWWNTAEPWLPVGDAAAAFDPLSGDGLCFALQSALGAADALALARDGHAEALDAYRAAVRSAWLAHVARRRVYYSLVKRFGPTSFWTRPRTSASLSA
jgi:flavin-dependent dehydrogenase